MSKKGIRRADLGQCTFNYPYTVRRHVYRFECPLRYNPCVLLNEQALRKEGPAHDGAFSFRVSSRPAQVKL